MQQVQIGLKISGALLANSIERNMAPPPDMDAGDSCYNYTTLLKVQINNHSKVVSIEFSDSAPQWIKDDIGRQIEKKRINLPALDSDSRGRQN